MITLTDWLLGTSKAVVDDFTVSKCCINVITTTVAQTRTNGWIDGWLVGWGMSHVYAYICTYVRPYVHTHTHIKWMYGYVRKGKGLKWKWYCYICIPSAGKNVCNVILLKKRSAFHSILRVKATLRHHVRTTK